MELKSHMTPPDFDSSVKPISTNGSSQIIQWCRKVKKIGVPVSIGGDNLLSSVGIGLSDLTNIGGGAVAPLAGPPGSGITARKFQTFQLPCFVHFWSCKSSSNEFQKIVCT